MPNDWKTANITAIYKKGNKNDPGNYRPVSLTCIVCKIFESILKDNISDYMESNNLFSDNQHGFRQKKIMHNSTIESNGGL